MKLNYFVNCHRVKMNKITLVLQTVSYLLAVAVAVAVASRAISLIALFIRITMILLGLFFDLIQALLAISTRFYVVNVMQNVIVDSNCFILLAGCCFVLSLPLMIASESQSALTPLSYSQGLHFYSSKIYFSILILFSPPFKCPPAFAILQVIQRLWNLNQPSNHSFCPYSYNKHFHQKVFLMSCQVHIFCYYTKKAHIQAFKLSIFDLLPSFYTHFMMLYWLGLPQFDYWAELGFVVNISISFYSIPYISAPLHIIQTYIKKFPPTCAYKNEIIDYTNPEAAQIQDAAFQVLTIILIAYQCRFLIFISVRYLLSLILIQPSLNQPGRRLIVTLLNCECYSSGYGHGFGCNCYWVLILVRKFLLWIQHVAVSRNC